MTFDAWRYWAITEDGQLAAPHAGDPLPKQRVPASPMQLASPTPAIGCRCGVHFHQRRGLPAAIDKFDLLTGEFAFTDGEATPPIFGDAWPLVRNGFQWTTYTRAYRASCYRVQTIYADAQLAYDLPVRPLSELPR